MSVRLLLAAPEAAQLSVTVGGYHIGSGRTVPTVAAVLGLISVVVGGSALARSARRVGAGRPAIIYGLVTGLTSLIAGGLHAANSTGGLGTGNGLAGAILALILGLTGTILSVLALTRSRRAAAAAEHRPDPAR